MSQYTYDQMRNARGTDLYMFLNGNYADLFNVEGDSLRLKANHSVSVKKDYSGYMDFATGETGNSVDFLVQYLNFSVPDAVFALCGEDDYVCTTSSGNANSLGNIKPAGRPGYELEVPQKLDGEFVHLENYLRARGIKTKIIRALVKSGILYESDFRHNIVFLNKERDWGEIKGSSTSYKFQRIIKGSRSDGFWWFLSGKQPEVVYICEAAVDAISLYQLHRENGMTEPACYVDIGGVAKQSAIDRLKRTGMHLVLAVDNDSAGQSCRDRNSELDFILPQNKDWNDDVMAGYHLLRY